MDIVLLRMDLTTHPRCIKHENNSKSWNFMELDPG